MSRPRTRFIVLTGGPGAGKSAVLELMRRMLKEGVAFVPEAASMVFSGGFPRIHTDPGVRCAQRAIVHVQRELERLTEEARQAPVAICDRGTLDALGYWPGSEAELWEQIGTNRKKELDRYFAVIHLRTPDGHNGYNHKNPVRIESAHEAALIDEKIYQSWEGHPRRFVVPSSHRFTEKAMKAVELILSLIPEEHHSREKR